MPAVPVDGMRTDYLHLGPDVVSVDALPDRLLPAPGAEVHDR